MPPDDTAPSDDAIAPGESGRTPSRREVRAAEAAVEIAALDAILKAGEADPEHLKWVLERRFPQRWGPQRLRVRKLKRRVRELEGRLGVDPGG